MNLPELPRDVADFGLDTLRRFIRIEGTQQATVLAAQAFTSLIPFFVVAAAFGPGGDLGDRIVDRFGLSGSSARSVQELFNSAGETESAVTWVSVIILASGIYVPILMTWSADRYGLIGIAFSLQSWLLVGGFVVVIGAVVGAVTNERYGERLDGLARRGAREPVG